MSFCGQYQPEHFAQMGEVSFPKQCDHIAATRCWNNSERIRVAETSAFA